MERRSDPLRQFSLFPGLASRSQEALAPLAVRTVSLVLPVSARDKDRLERLAAAKGETPGRIIQSALMIAGPSVLDSAPDLPPGTAKLRLKVSPDVTPQQARAALAFVLALEDGAIGRIDRQAEAQLQRAGELLGEARDAIEKLAFEPLAQGIRTARQAAHIMGFQGELGLTEAMISARFRKLAPIYHPDTGFIEGDRHMAQLLEARRVLLEYLRSL